MSSPFFSICIPAYNCGNIIYEALRSVAFQTLDDWEVVVADDGSQDDTAIICEQQDIILPSKYTFIRTEHSGLLDTRRQLHDAAQGSFIISLDADDALCDCNALKKIYSLLVENSCDFVMFNATRSLATMDKFIDYGPLIMGSQGFVDFDSARRLFCRSYSLNNIWAKAYRRDLVNYACLDLTVQMTEDRLQSLQLFLNGKSCRLIDEPLYYYRPNEGSMTEGTFPLSYVEDQLYVEQQVDSLREVIGGPSEMGSCLAAWVLSNDLVRVHRVSGDKSQEFENFKKLYRIWSTAPYFDAEIPTDARVDRKISYFLFRHKQFAVLRLFLEICTVAKQLHYLVISRGSNGGCA